jgi:hypothetical protein
MTPPETTLRIGVAAENVGAESEGCGPDAAERSSDFSPINIA